MDTRRWWMLGMVCLATSGCRTSPQTVAHIEMMAAERRALEDLLYELEDENEELRRELERCQERGAAGKPAASDRSAVPPSSRSRASSRGADGLRPPLDLSPPSVEGGATEPRVEMPGDQPTPPDLTPPRVELPLPEPTPAPATPTEPSPVAPAVPPGAAPQSRHPPSQPTPVVSSSRPVVLNVSDPRIASLHIDAARTGGVDLDRQPGDDGLAILLQPRNEAGEYVPLAGPLLIVVLDYAKRGQGEAAYVARWELDAATVQRYLVNTDTTHGIQMKLPWPQSAPEHEKLRVDARYTTADGRQVDARQDLFVMLADRYSQRWTPRGETRLASPAAYAFQLSRQPAVLGTAENQASSSPAATEPLLLPAQGGNGAAATAELPTPRWTPLR